VTALHRGVGKPAHTVPRRGRGQLAGDAQLRCTVLHRLKRPDRSAELIARLDEFGRGIRAPGDDPGGLNGHHRHDDVGGLVGLDPAQAYRLGDIDVAEPNDCKVAS
jgi:hypothetical protein